MGKRKIVDTKGCTAYSLEIDGENISELSINEQAEILKSIIDSLKEEFSLVNLISTLVEEYGDYGSDPNICEQCGDSISWSTLEID